MKLSIKQASGLVRFMGAFCKGIADAKKDGKINFLDVTHFLPLISLVGPAFSSINDVFDEIRDLSQEETDELLVIFAEESDLPINDQTRELMGIALNTGADISKLVLHFSKK